MRDGAEVASIIEDFASGASQKDIAAFVERLVKRSHRTIQQRTMVLVMALIEGWADAADHNNFDLRNEATVKLAKLITTRVDKYERVLPYI